MLGCTSYTVQTKHIEEFKIIHFAVRHRESGMPSCNGDEYTTAEFPICEPNNNTLVRNGATRFPSIFWHTECVSALILGNIVVWRQAISKIRLTGYMLRLNHQM